MQTGHSGQGGSGEDEEGEMRGGARLVDVVVGPEEAAPGVGKSLD